MKYIVEWEECDELGLVGGDWDTFTREFDDKEEAVQFAHKIHNNNEQIVVTVVQLEAIVTLA